MNTFDWKQYLANYKDLRDAGINNLDAALDHYRRFGSREGRTYEKKDHLVLYKNYNSVVIDFSNKTTKKINGEDTTFYSSTPAIVELGDEYIVNIRYVNYIKDIYDPDHTYSLNKILKLDKTFVVKKEYFFDSNFKDKYKHNGLEDIKLFNDNGVLYYIGCIFHNKKACITSNLFNNKYDLNIIKTNFDNRDQWEKNWCHFKNGDKLNLIYKWYPLTVCEINENKLDILQQIEVPSFFEDLRGSTNGVTYNNSIWFIAHVNKKGNYFHIILVFDLDMNLKKHSEFFKFEDFRVEFCLGLIVKENKFIVSYSTNDNTSKIMIIPNIEKLLKKITNSE